MRTYRRLFGLTLVVILGGIAACGGQAKEEAEPPAAHEEATEAPAAEQQQGAVQEQSVVAYDSTTHGALEVRSVQDNPADWFEVLQDGKRVLPGNPKLLNGTVELAPGAYDVDVNRTQRKVTIEAGKKTVLWTGELLVEGEPAGAYWYPMEGTERRVTSNPPVLNASRDLFPGAYTVFVHVSVTMPDKNLGTAEVKAGQRTVLKH